MNIGRAIKLVRTHKNFNQAKLARLAGISESYLSLLEQDKRDPSLSTLENISEALRIPFSILVFLAADKEDLKNIDSSLAEKLSFVALQLIGESQNH